MSDEYLMRMTTEQAEQMHRALEFYARIGIGQLEEGPNHPAVVAQWNSMTGRSPEDARAMIAQLKGELLGLSASLSQSIYSEQVPDNVRVVWDIRNVIRHKLATDRSNYEPTPGFAPLTTVDLDTPTPASSQALPVIENVTKLEGDVDALKQTSADLQQRLAVVLAKLGGEMSHDTKRGLLYVGWVIANGIGVGCITYGHTWILRLIGWLWVSFAISLSGMVMIGLIAREEIKKD